MSDLGIVNISIERYDELIEKERIIKLNTSIYYLWRGFGTPSLGVEDCGLVSLNESEAITELKRIIDLKQKELKEDENMFLELHRKYTAVPDKNWLQKIMKFIRT